MTREEAIAILDGFKHNPLFNEQHFEALDMAISALSENKGEWIEVVDYKDDNRYEWHIICSVCRHRGMFESDNFCPNCGADMRGET